MPTQRIVMLVILLVLVVQWAFAMPCLMRLFREKLRGRQFWFWNIFILLGIVVGPVTYLATSSRRAAKRDQEADSRRNAGGGDYSI